MIAQTLTVHIAPSWRFSKDDLSCLSSVIARFETLLLYSNFTKTITKNIKYNEATTFRNAYNSFVSARPSPFAGYEEGGIYLIRGTGFIFDSSPAIYGEYHFSGYKKYIAGLVKAGVISVATDDNDEPNENEEE